MPTPNTRHKFRSIIDVTPNPRNIEIYLFVHKITVESDFHKNLARNLIKSLTFPSSLCILFRESFAIIMSYECSMMFCLNV